MFSQVTVTAMAAPLAVASALFALVFLRYGIPRAARNGPTRNGQGTVGISVLLCIGNVGLVVIFLVFVAQCFSFGTGPLLFPMPTPPLRCVQPCRFYPSDPTSVMRWTSQVVRMMQATLIVALFWYTLSIAVLAIEMSAGGSRGQRRSASSE
jgi:hypothetical protein